MKILYVYDVIARHGGMERVIVDKMNCFSQLEDMNVYLLTTNQGCHPIPFKLDQKVHYEDLGVQTHLQYRYHGLRRLWEGYRRNRLLEKRMTEKILDVQPDVIICTTSRLVSTMVHLKGHIPLVIESHSDFENVLECEHDSWLNRIKRIMRYRQIQKASVIVTLTEEDAKAWRTIHSKVVVIPNLAHLNDTNMNSDCMSHHAIYMGRYCNQKGLPELLKVWTLVHQKHPDWILDMYGDGELGEWLRKEVSRLNIGIQVHEPVDDVFSCYCNSSMLMLTSTWEPFGLVIPEAMSCGVPVVSFAGLKGPDSIINDGYDGFLIENRNVDIFANRVCQLIEDNVLCQRLGKNAIKSSQRYKTDTIIPLWRGLIESLTMK